MGDNNHVADTLVCVIVTAPPPKKIQSAVMTTRWGGGLEKLEGESLTFLAAQRFELNVNLRVQTHLQWQSKQHIPAVPAFTLHFGKSWYLQISFFAAAFGVPNLTALFRLFKLLQVNSWVQWGWKWLQSRPRCKTTASSLAVPLLLQVPSGYSWVKRLEPRWHSFLLKCKKIKTSATTLMPKERDGSGRARGEG